MSRTASSFFTLPFVLSSLARRFINRLSMSQRIDMFEELGSGCETCGAAGASKLYSARKHVISWVLFSFFFD